MISYQWYSNTKNSNTDGTTIDGATNATYTPPTTTVGTKYYYVIAINTITDNGDGGTKTENITSNIAKITVEANFFSVNEIGDTITDYTGDAATLTIPSTINGKTITKIGDGAFYNSSSLKSIVIPNSVTRIGREAFHSCNNLESITIGNSVEVIDGSAFWGCSNLESVIIPDSVTHIASSVFHGCSNLESVTIGNSVTMIGGGAFYNCRSLITLTIPSSITSIGSEVFYFCNSLESIFIEATNPPLLYTNMYEEDAFTKAPSNMVIYVPAESLGFYKTANKWSSYKTRIQAI